MLFRLYLYFWNCVNYILSSTLVLTVAVDVIFILSINKSYEMFGCYVVGPFQFVAVSVCGPFGVWPICFVASAVRGCFGFVTFLFCGPFGLWRFQFAVVFGLRPFRMCLLLSMTVTTCYHYDTCFHQYISSSVRSNRCKWYLKNKTNVHCVLWCMENIPNTHGAENCFVPFPRYLFLCLVNLNLIICASGSVTGSAVVRYFTKHNPKQ